MVDSAAIFKKLIKMYEPGGASTAGVKSSLDRSRTKFMSSGMQNLVSSGLSNTTMSAGLAGKFAEEVEAPTLAASESERIGKLSGILMSQAEMAQQAEQAKLGRQMQYDLNRPTKPAGYNTFGEPMPGTLAYSQANPQASATKPQTATQPDYTALFAKIKSLSAPVYYQPSNTSSTPVGTGAMSSTMSQPHQTWSNEELQALNKRMGNI